jgi:hypothetical protein
MEDSRSLHDCISSLIARIATLPRSSRDRKQGSVDRGISTARSSGPWRQDVCWLKLRCKPPYLLSHAHVVSVVILQQLRDSKPMKRSWRATSRVSTDVLCTHSIFSGEHMVRSTVVRLVIGCRRMPSITNLYRGARGAERGAGAALAKQLVRFLFKSAKTIGWHSKPGGRSLHPVVPLLRNE